LREPGTWGLAVATEGTFTISCGRGARIAGRAQGADDPLANPDATAVLGWMAFSFLGRTGRGTHLRYRRLHSWHGNAREQRHHRTAAGREDPGACFDGRRFRDVSDIGTEKSAYAQDDLAIDKPKKPLAPRSLRFTCPERNRCGTVQFAAAARMKPRGARTRARTCARRKRGEAVASRVLHSYAQSEHGERRAARFLKEKWPAIWWTAVVGGCGPEIRRNMSGDFNQPCQKRLCAALLRWLPRALAEGACRSSSSVVPYNLVNLSFFFFLRGGVTSNRDGAAFRCAERVGARRAARFRGADCGSSRRDQVLVSTWGATAAEDSA